jgi:hypothetical protein
METVMVFCETLLCHWVYWAPVAEGELSLLVEVDNSADMTGCIKVAGSLMPAVRKVSVWQDGKPMRLINQYELDDLGAWRCVFSAPTLA